MIVQSNGDSPDLPTDPTLPIWSRYPYTELRAVQVVVCVVKAVTVRYGL